MQYEKHVSKRRTPQRRAIPGRESQMVKNHGGGFAFSVDDWMRMQRFLILGSEGGTYYVGESKLTRENAYAVERCIAHDGKRAVDMIVGISKDGRGIKNDPAIFALALAASAQDTETRGYALSKLRDVCRIPTHLAQFINAVTAQRGWGRSLKRAVAKWFTDADADRLAMHAVKYRQREGYELRDIVRLSHPKGDEAHDLLVRYMVDGLEGQKPWDGSEKYPTRDSRKPLDVNALPEIVQAYEEAKTADINGLVRLIRDHGLTREMIPNKHLNGKRVWEALLERMPLWAMIRNLGKMSQVGLLKPLSDASKLVTERLSNQNALQRARVHPMTILIAQTTYAKGHGFRGKLTWSPVSQVIDALDAAFYKTFVNVEPTGQNILCALDVSGSMGAEIAGTGLTCMQAGAAMALILINTEPNYELIAFSDGTGTNIYGGVYGGRSRAKRVACQIVDGAPYTYSGSRYGETAVVPINLSKKMRLTDAVSALSGLGFGGTDCALPMIYAKERGLAVNVFEVITDSETWAGQIHPTQALSAYRDATHSNAKLAVIGMTATEISIADPDDKDQMDFVGFDTTTPKAIEEFIRL
jgi:60 kDa SS-A/Ro ribonucleoprotein